jgi:hypothetical protein
MPKMFICATESLQVARADARGFMGRQVPVRSNKPALDNGRRGVDGLRAGLR